jgi:hypothetical protein
MTKKTGVFSAITSEPLKIAEAIEQYVAQGGVINVVPEGESAETATEAAKMAQELDPEAQMNAKLEQLKGLVAKGAGVSALQYSLRMNRKEIKRLANENGLKILYSRPVRSRPARSRDTAMVDDSVAGHAMHYSSLGYTAQEIAQLLDLSVRDVWNIGKAYRFEFKNTEKIDAPEHPSSDMSESEK